jgi:tRNA G18 (ribose-2'-O)-methylase SpoU
MDYKALHYRFPAVLLIGSEKRGLSEQLLEAADFVVRIRICGACDSINAAVAAGVLLLRVNEATEVHSLACKTHPND